MRRMNNVKKNEYYTLWRCGGGWLIETDLDNKKPGQNLRPKGKYVHYIHFCSLVPKESESCENVFSCSMLSLLERRLWREEAKTLLLIKVGREVTAQHKQPNSIWLGCGLKWNNGNGVKRMKMMHTFGSICRPKSSWDYALGIRSWVQARLSQPAVSPPQKPS